MGGKRNKRFESQGGVRVLHEQKRARLSSEGILAGGVRGGSRSAGRCRISKKSREGSSTNESCQEF